MELLVLLVALVVTPACPSPVLEGIPAGKRSGDRVESLGPRDGGLVGYRGGWGVSTTSPALTARCVVRRELTSAEAVGEGVRRDTGSLTRGVWTSRGWGTH